MWDKVGEEARRSWMRERRRVGRTVVDMSVRKHINGDAYCCRACEISPTGIRLEKPFSMDSGTSLIDIEVPLVEGRLTTSVPARKVWCEGGFEAFEFVDPSFAQQAMLERIFGNF